jgi:magnesium chelatase accessory protein
MSARLSWQFDSANWPHRDASRFVDAGNVQWHVQTFVSNPNGAPIAILLHGTGASTHSWRGLAPLLSRHFDVITFDLPGHAFTSALPPTQMGLRGMGRAVADLLKRLSVTPSLLVGHSAGAAIAVQMCLDSLVEPAAVVGLNSALLPFDGIQGHLFSPIAKLLAASSWAPRFFSWHASSPIVLRRLIDGTGSALDEEGARLYGQLIRSPGHAAGALNMMANWDLPELASRLDQLQQPLWLVTGGRDAAIPRSHATRIVSRVPETVLVEFPTLGHLAHEEAPAVICNWIVAQSRANGILLG